MGINIRIKYWLHMLKILRNLLVRLFYLLYSLSLDTKPETQANE